MNEKFTAIAVLAVVFIILSFTGCNQPKKEKSRTDRESIERGEYLVRFAGCSDCHTPKVLTLDGPAPDVTRLLSGHPSDSELPDFDFSLVESGKWILFNGDGTATAGPWGVTFATNLTPDEETGSGLWTEDMFIKAMRNGRHLGTGRPILPPMPWYGLGQLKNEDLKAIFAYFQSLKPVKNLVPAPIPASELGNDLK